MSAGVDAAVHATELKKYRGGATVVPIGELASMQIQAFDATKPRVKMILKVERVAFLMLVSPIILFIWCGYFWEPKVNYSVDSKTNSMNDAFQHAKNYNTMLGFGRSGLSWIIGSQCYTKLMNAAFACSTVEPGKWVENMAIMIVTPLIPIAMGFHLRD